jgi:ABC-2 type transport system ATP-binding protein
MLIMSHGETLAMGTPSEIRDLVLSDDNPLPSIDDAFIALAEGIIKPQQTQTGAEDIMEDSR